MTAFIRFMCLIVPCVCEFTASALGASTVSLVPLDAPKSWSRQEYIVEGVPEAANPFDSDCIRVDGVITAPSGRVLVVPAFWYQGYRRQMDGSSEKLVSEGAPQWRLRFTPEEVGHYDVKITISENNGPAKDEARAQFDADAATDNGTRHGWVRVASDGRYFETSDGTPLRLIGENVCWAGGRGTHDFDDWFGAMEKSGQNFARLWLDPWDMSIEQTPGTLTRYSQEGAWKLDYVFDLAQKKGIYLMLCMDHHGMYQADDKGWGGTNNFWDSSNPYSKSLGGPCAKADEFFTSEEAAKIYQKRLRYLIARYGYSPRLHSWQLFNEIDNIYRQNGIVPEHVLEWHKKMATALKQMDPYGHLVTTSLTGGSERDEYWRIPQLDYAIYHSYGDSAPGRKVARLAQRYERDFKKPFMIGEYGTSAYTLNLDNDPYLRGFRQILWSGVTGGSCGTAMSWWWEDIHSQDLYPIYASLSRILDEAGWNEGEWTPIPVEYTAPSVEMEKPVAAAELFSADVMLNQARRMALGGEVAVISPLAAARAAESLQAHLYGKGAQWHCVERIHVAAKAKSSLNIKVDSIAADAVLVLRIDGTEVLRKSIAWTGKPADATSAANLDETIPLAVGRHIIEIENQGDTEWLHVSTLRFNNLAETKPVDGRSFKPEFTVLVGKNAAILHVVSPYTVYPANAKTVNPPLVESAVVSFSGLPDGKYVVRWYNTMDGSLVAELPAKVRGAAKLPVPAFRDQLAAVVLPAVK